MSPIQVLMVEDHPVVRGGIEMLLKKEVDIHLVGQATTGQQALQMAEDLQPDIVLLDMELPDLPGVEVARRLIDAGYPLKVLVFSGHADPEFVRALLDAGIAGYLMKEEALDVLLDAIRGVHHGQTGWFSRRINAQITAMLNAPETGKPRFTPREMEVMRAIVEGKTNRQIAAQLSISEKTVEKYNEILFRKLNATSRVEVAVISVREGLV